MSGDRPLSQPTSHDPTGRGEAGTQRTGTNDLRVAVRSLVAATLKRAPQNDIQDLVSIVCTLTHQERAPIERLLIILRAEWTASDPLNGVPPATREAIRARLASECINAFYNGQH